MELGLVEEHDAACWRRSLCGSVQQLEETGANVHRDTKDNALTHAGDRVLVVLGRECESANE